VVFLALATVAAGPVDDGFARERKGDKKRDLPKDAMEGKAPPALEVKSWMNTKGKSLDLKKLVGKVVVLDFWGTW